MSKQPDSLALLKNTTYHSAPVTTRFVPQRRTADAVKAVFDPEDSPTKPPQQSASEQQRFVESSPMHGLKIWASLMTCVSSTYDIQKNDIYNSLTPK